MRIGALCNSRFGLPTLNALAAGDALAAVAIPALQHEATLRIHELAQVRGIPFAAIEESGANDALAAWREQSALDVVLVLSFPYRIAEAVLAAPPLGVWNYHASPLPRHRGPDPIYWQLRAGARESAVTIHRMVAELDAGPIAWAEPFEIGPDDHYGLVSAKAAVAAVHATQSLVRLLQEHAAELPVRDQPDVEATTDPRPTPDDLCIDWSSMSAEDVKALVQACNPDHGGAVVFVRGAAVRVYEVALAGDAGGRAAGTLALDEATGAPRVACADGRELELRVFYSDDGLFSGARFARAYALAPGESLARPA